MLSDFSKKIPEFQKKRYCSHTTVPSDTAFRCNKILQYIGCIENWHYVLKCIEICIGCIVFMAGCHGIE
jgi:hypothetical protein